MCKPNLIAGREAILEFLAENLPNTYIDITVMDLPRSRGRLVAHDQRLVPVLVEQIEHIELVAAVIGQWVRPWEDATKHPHLMAVERTAVIGQRRRTSIYLQPTMHQCMRYQAVYRPCLPTLTTMTIIPDLDLFGTEVNTKKILGMAEIILQWLTGMDLRDN